MYTEALKRLGVKKMPTTAVARARLFAELNQKLNKKATQEALRPQKFTLGRRDGF